jgi:drug/metabolite transporter (DMT)-like permease
MELERANADRTHGASPAVLLAGAAWLAVYFTARAALQYLRPESFEAMAMAIAPLFAFYAFVWVVQRAVRRADELQRLIQLDALAFAFSTATCVLMGLGLLDIASGGLEFPPLRDWWAMLPALYAICLVVARRRYR